MSARASTIAQGFSQKVMKALYDKNLLDQITNRDYEGEINGIGSKLTILDFDKVSEKTYANSALTADSLTENNGALVIDQYKSFYWKEKTLDNWLSYIKNPHPTIVEQVANERARNMDTFAFGLYTKVGAGNRVGTDNTAGTVAVDASGNVTGTNTTFTAAMVGRGFKATGHTKWYRVKSYASGTSIVIEDDLDDVASQYTGGVINSTATYVIEAATPVAITTSNLVQQIAALKLKLDKAEANSYHAVPGEGRFLIVPPEFEDIVVRASGVLLHVPEVYDNLVQKGMIGMLLGFKLFRSNRLTGDNTNGYRVIAGHSSWLTFAQKVLQSRIEEDLLGDFGAAYKDLFVYGAKVKDARRHFAAEGYFTFTL
jgi:hypothetical protein